MIRNRKVSVILRFSIRQYQSQSKFKVLGNEEVIQNVENNVYSARRHPGIVKQPTNALPDNVVKSIRNIIEDHPIKLLAQSATLLNRKLLGRLPPMEAEGVSELKSNIFEKVMSKEASKVAPDKLETDQFKQKVKDKVINMLKVHVYNWSPIVYDAYNSLVYLIGRSAPEYSVLVKIFTEIQLRDKDFKPRSLFDFGSGVGTVTWAANIFWKQNLFEYYNVDTSSFMNDLAQIILQGGRGSKQSNLKGVYYRQFMPSNNTTYDLVVSAYTLMELPSFQSRMEAVMNLWNKTERYLIIVELGTKAGFNIINEARDFVLQIKDERNRGHVFSPCPHDFACPKYMSSNYACNFEVNFINSSTSERMQLMKEQYSYVVLKKGARDERDERWPRAVKETLVRSKHSICRLCTANGSLDEVIFTASKHGKSTFHCARSTKWGDRLPVTLTTKSEEDN
ncbi:PREDICTED: methyltransferase-like protein 17, mitochondrial [Nicrophorus vespilloides]|uniref:Methyltransferase-like protein 17, mitochondrial n=1 Tax=Nicrophorus vespilloides TaxID=110193 RepID=A0ABM1MW31_NICVS|nr:PREDICTED: methyltransferase-like protein 17, mitochondrial [Nicrophorus vespilloides]